MNHYKARPDDTEVYCPHAREWSSAHVDTSDTGPACEICDFCNTLLIDDDKTVTPDHIHLNGEWFCDGDLSRLDEGEDRTYTCADCKAQFTLTPKGQTNGS